jgi:hypothetical protein
MTDDRNPIQPNGPDPAVDPLDERLSAELDGAAAPETTATEAPGTDDAYADIRRRELASARDLLAIPPPPLDDVTRRRLLRAALNEGSPAKRRDLHVLNRVGVAAAVLAVVVAGALTLKAMGRSDNGSKAASKSADNKNASATTTAPTRYATDFGVLSDPQVLKSRVRKALRDAPGPTSAAPQRTEASPDQADAAAKLPLGNCDATVRVPAGARPTVLGNGTFNGAPAVVLVAHDGARTLIFVVATSDCRLLTSQFFGG